jgi:hypothetical protein
MSGARRRLSAALAALIVVACSAPAAATATPIPNVTGPLPATAASYPFGAADHQLVPQDLRREGYVEEEYLLSGKANVYSWPAPGPAVVRTAGAPYTTRALVRRPADPKRFSGNVVVEMLNPSNSFDLNIGWALTHRQILRNGDAWVGITIKPVSVEALKKFDPQRYAPLSFANPLPLSDPANCNVTGTDSRLTENGLAWDIYSQAGAWVRSHARANPLTYGAGKRVSVKHVYGFGYSQTGGYMYDYINGIQPLVVQSDGKPLYDGYIVAVAGGGFVGAVPMNQCEAAPPVGDPRRQFSDVGVPIIHVMSQSDYLGGIAARRPDSDSPSDPYRHYEMAGAGHATPDELYYSAAPADIVKAGRAVPPLSCNEGPRSRFPSSIFLDAALRNLEGWAGDGIAPPHADPILVSGGQPVLDEHGNVLGGLRSPFLDVPTSTWYGSSTGASFCFIAGHEVPFSHEKLEQLYLTHGRYVRAVAEDTLNLVKQRIITAPDGVQLVRDAARADVP